MRKANLHNYKKFISGYVAQKGLSLIEVMVAMAILAGVAVSIITLVSQSSRFVANSEQRIMAIIVADNEVTRDLLTNRPLDEGDDLVEVIHSGRQWTVARTTVDLGEGLYRIKIDVRISGGEQVLASVETLKAQSQ